MSVKRRAIPHAWPYILLALLLDLSLISQVTFTVDSIRAWRRDYPLRPFSLGAPWPTVLAESDASQRAGLRLGDRVIAVDGRTLQGLQDLPQIVRAHRTGDILRVTASRNGQPSDFAVGMGPVVLDYGEIVVTFILMPWISLALGFWVAAVRPRDKLAWMMLGILMGLSQLQRPQLLDSLGWPAVLGVSVAEFRELSVVAWAISMMLFGFYFPKRGRLDTHAPWVKWVVLVPVALFGIWDAIRNGGLAVAFDATYRLIPANPLPNWVQQIPIYIAVSLFFSAIGAKYSDPALGGDDRRRLRLLYWGCTLSMTPFGIVHFISPGGPLISWASMSLILFPATLAYVIVVQRAMDVRMVIRQGIQYALARRGIKVLQALLTVTVVVGAVQISNQSHLSQPRQLILIAGTVIVTLRIVQMGDRLRRWVDRRFFREAYKAEQILGELSEEVRGILEQDALLERVARRISESLHVERVAVLLQQNGAFRPAFALGYPGGPAVSLPAELPVVTELRQKRDPVVVEKGALQELDAELLLPLASKKDLLGFISLGPKRSEEPYSPSDTNLLRSVAAQTGLALENSHLTEAIAAEVAHREMLNREIEIAREVQQRLFPQNSPEVPSLSYAGYCRPARGVGGDYYDFLSLAGGRFGLAIGDVSGKGVPAALLMASLQASVRGQSQSADGQVAQLMSNVNRLVCDASPENRYATFFYAQFDPATRILTYSNGGHNPPILLRGNEVIRLEKGGAPVGLFRIAPYAQDEIQLQPGDLMVLFTDGISEAENPAEEEWGEEALIETSRACEAIPPQEAIERIMQAADAFAAGAPQHDDMTLVVARVVSA